MDSITIFGTTVLRHGAQQYRAHQLGGVKPRQVLEILAVAAGTPVPKDRMAEMLWDGRPPRGWLTTLQSHVSVLRHCSGLGTGRHGAIATADHGYLLDVERVQVDHDVATQLLAGAQHSAKVGAVQRALRIAESGELLVHDPYAAWAEEARQTFCARLVDALLRVSAAQQISDPDLALHLACAAWERAPLSEAAAQAVMRGHRVRGDRGSALGVYLTLETRLRDELGVTPCATTVRIREELLRGMTDPASAGAPPAWRSGLDRAESDVREVLALLADVLRQPGGVLDADRAERIDRFLLTRSC